MRYPIIGATHQGGATKRYIVLGLFVVCLIGCLVTSAAVVLSTSITATATPTPDPILTFRTQLLTIQFSLVYQTNEYNAWQHDYF